MKKTIVLVFILLVGIILGASAVLKAQDHNIEYIFNRIWDSTANTIKVTGQ